MKNSHKYNHENLVMQAWGLCFAMIDEFSFETKIFRKVIETAIVTQEQFESLINCFNVIYNIHSELDISDANQKRIAKRIVTRTHLVALTKIIMDALEDDYEILHIIEWVKVFFDGGRSASVDSVYNTSCGAGSARRDKIDARMNAMNGHFISYMTRIGQRTPTDNSRIELESEGDENTDADQYVNEEKYAI